MGFPGFWQQHPGPSRQVFKVCTTLLSLIFSFSFVHFSKKMISYCTQHSIFCSQVSYTECGAFGLLQTGNQDVLGFYNHSLERILNAR